MVEIILDPDRGLEEQVRELLDLADPESAEAQLTQWNPRPDKPHGGVVVVPDSLAQRYESRAVAKKPADKRGRRADTGGSTE